MAAEGACQTAGWTGFGAKPPARTAGRLRDARKGQAKEQNKKQCGDTNDVFKVGGLGCDLAGQAGEHENLLFVPALFSHLKRHVKNFLRTLGEQNVTPPSKA